MHVCTSDRRDLFSSSRSLSFFCKESRGIHVGVDVLGSRGRTLQPQERETSATHFVISELLYCPSWSRRSDADLFYYFTPRIYTETVIHQSNEKKMAQEKPAVRLERHEPSPDASQAVAAYEGYPGFIM